MRRVLSVLVLGLLALAGAGPRAIAAGADNAPIAPLATESLLLDLAHAGDRIVAVGAQGVVLHSDDQGETWVQARVPSQEMLTGVSFYDARTGWAVGHGGTVLRSADGGATWDLVAVPVDAETSFLDVLALDARHVFAIGAYEVFLESRDGGHTWESRSALGEKEDFDRVHLNRITRGPSGLLCLAGEYGTLALSHDRGITWQKLESPYEGSFYGLHELRKGGRLLAHGLRSHVFTSDDHGATWTQVEIETEVLLMAAAQGNDDTVVLAGLGGNLFVSRDRADSFVRHRPDELTGTAEVTFTRDGRLICVGDSGVHRLPVP